MIFIGTRSAPGMLDTTESKIINPKPWVTSFLTSYCNSSGCEEALLWLPKVRASIKLSSLCTLSSRLSNGHLLPIVSREWNLFQLGWHSKIGCGIWPGQKSEPKPREVSVFALMAALRWKLCCSYISALCSAASRNNLNWNSGTDGCSQVLLTAAWTLLTRSMGQASTTTLYCLARTGSVCCKASAVASEKLSKMAKFGFRSGSWGKLATTGRILLGNRWSVPATIVCWIDLDWLHCVFSAHQPVIFAWSFSHNKYLMRLKSWMHSPRMSLDVQSCLSPSGWDVGSTFTGPATMMQVRNGLILGDYCWGIWIFRGRAQVKWVRIHLYLVQQCLALNSDVEIGREGGWVGQAPLGPNAISYSLRHFAIKAHISSTLSTGILSLGKQLSFLSHGLKHSPWICHLIQILLVFSPSQVSLLFTWTDLNVFLQLPPSRILNASCWLVFLTTTSCFCPTPLA